MLQAGVCGITIQHVVCARRMSDTQARTDTTTSQGPGTQEVRLALPLRSPIQDDGASNRTAPAAEDIPIHTRLRKYGLSSVFVIVSGGVLFGCWLMMQPEEYVVVPPPLAPPRPSAPPGEHVSPVPPSSPPLVPSSQHSHYPTLRDVALSVMTAGYSCLLLTSLAACVMRVQRARHRGRDVDPLSGAPAGNAGWGESLLAGMMEDSTRQESPRQVSPRHVSPLLQRLSGRLGGNSPRLPSPRLSSPRRLSGGGGGPSSPQLPSPRGLSGGWGERPHGASPLVEQQHVVSPLAAQTHNVLILAAFRE